MIPFIILCLGILLTFLQTHLGLGFWLFLNTFLPKAGFETKFLPFHLNVVDILFLLLLIRSFIRSFQLKVFLRFYILVILLCWGLCSAVHGYLRGASISKIIDEFLRQYIYIFTAFFVTFSIRSSKEYNQILSFFSIALGLLSVYGVLQFILGIKFVEFSKNILLKFGYPSQADFFSMFYEPNVGRITTTLLCWNGTGQYLASASSLLLAAIFLDKKISLCKRTAYLCILILCLIALLLTRSRSAWVGLFAATVLLGIIKFKRNFYLMLLPFVFFLLLFVILNPRIYERIKSFGNLMQNGTAKGRIEAIKASLPVIKKSPLIGYGLGMYKSQKINANYALYGGLDCFYVRYIISHGWIGLIIFLFTVFWLYMKTLTKVKFKNINQDWILAGSISALASFLVGGVFDSMLVVSTYIISIFWFHFGVILTRIYKTSENNPFSNHTIRSC